jgi:hypothetical protein
MNRVRELKRPQSVIRLLSRSFLLTKHTVEQTVQMLNHFRPSQSMTEIGPPLTGHERLFHRGSPYQFKSPVL